MRTHNDTNEALAQPPGEGEDGLFTQSWFPICLSTDVAPGTFRGYDFLDGRVIVMRDEQGVAQVLSAYCRHLGADLSGGEMIEGTIRCPFHYWRYAIDGRCVGTGSGDPAPPAARLFRFPTMEKYGCVFAFNGSEPLFEMPDFPRPAATLRWKFGTYERLMHVDPWVICCNTPDMQHIKSVHGIQFDGGEPHDQVQWTPTSMVYRLRGRHRGGQPVDFRVGIYGSNIYFQEGEIDGRWFGFMAPMGLARPKNSTLFLAVAVEDDPADPAGTQQFLDRMYALEAFVASEDLPIVENAHFRPGNLTRSDRSLARFLRYLRDYPRAHPSASCIR
ncbi:MAG TPA: Rieske 2Fe-2S domain-containing protein [Steroidobacteraceae bacterium]|nr:Rieske 2Fe-2S domain-containing protein [Steroidobacteraceae bacterium]